MNLRHHRRPDRPSHIYDGRGKTFFFGEYQGFRQVLGTTQVLPVPRMRSARESTRQPFQRYADRSSQPAIAPLLARYPLRTTLRSIRARTFATSSKIVTTPINSRFASTTSSRQSHSVHTLQPESSEWADETGPNCHRPSFAVKFFDHQRNAAVRYTRSFTPHLTSSSAFGYIRTARFPGHQSHRSALATETVCFKASIPPTDHLRLLWNVYQIKTTWRTRAAPTASSGRRNSPQQDASSWHQS
jgi:hypothetical protein